MRVVDPVSQVELIVPPYATPERTIARARLQREGRLRQLRFYPDGTYPWSLWEAGAENNMPSPAELGLSANLTEELRRLFEDWSVNFRYDGPQDEAFARRWRAKAAELTARLEEETYDFAQVLPAWDAVVPEGV